MNLPSIKDARIRTKEKSKEVFLSNNKSNKYMGNKYYIRTYGCQMNVHDSEEISARLENLDLLK